MDFTLLDNHQIIQRISHSLKDKRLSLNLTQAQLAKKANLSLPTIKKFESGKPPSFLTLIAILRSLGEIQQLEALSPRVNPSPKEIYQAESKKRKRASNAQP